MGRSLLAFGGVVWLAGGRGKRGKRESARRREGERHKLQEKEIEK